MATFPTQSLNFHVFGPKDENYSDDHSARAIDRLIQQYRNSEEFKAFIEVACDGFQDAEDALNSIYRILNIDAMKWWVLDLIGEIVDAPREGSNDAEYRVKLKAKIGINNSNGTLDDVIKIWRLISGAQSINASEVYPAHIQIISDSIISDQLLAFSKDYFPESTAGGVSINVIRRSNNPKKFKFSSTSNQRFNEGFGDTTDPLAGGGLASIII